MPGNTQAVPDEIKMAMPITERSFLPYVRGENKKVMKKALSVILAILTVSALMIASVATAGAKIPENSEYVSLDKVEVEEKGNNLAGLFTYFAKTDSASEGANGKTSTKQK